MAEPRKVTGKDAVRSAQIVGPLGQLPCADKKCGCPHKFHGGEDMQCMKRGCACSGYQDPQEAK